MWSYFTILSKIVQLLWPQGRPRGCIHYTEKDGSCTDSTLAFLSLLRYQTCMAFESIDELARRLAESVPQGLRSVKSDLERNFRSVLQSGLGKLDLVTREEFEVQEAVLARTRQKLEMLEERLESVEAAKATTKKKSKKATRKK